MNKLRPLALLIVLALGACSGLAPSASRAKHTPVSTPTSSTTPEVVKEGSHPGDGPADPFETWSKSDIPRWQSERTDIGGLPVPKGWKLVERRAHGYQIDETYQAPKGVDPGEFIAWYRQRVPFDKPWGGWTPCFSGTGANEHGVDTWAFRNPEHTDHVIQMLVGIPDGIVTVDFERNDAGDCFVE